MSEFDLFAQELLEKAEAEEKQQQERDRKLIDRVLEIYDQKYVAELLRKIGKNEWSRETLNRWINGKCEPKSLTMAEEALLRKMLPEQPVHHPDYDFRFIDLFAGIGGIRKGFEAIGGQCVFTSEWNKEAVRTYKANWYNDENAHTFNLDIREVTLSGEEGISEEKAYAHIDQHIPDHDVLLAGFPCQPFSLAGVSKKNSLGRAHGFECEAQGTLFFDVARIIKAKQPAIFVLENVKNLKSHDKGKTFKVIMDTLDELGYEVADASITGKDDPKIIDGKNFLPQHRERIVLVGFRRDLNIHQGFTLKNIHKFYPEKGQHLVNFWTLRLTVNISLALSYGNISITMLKSMLPKVMGSVLVWLIRIMKTASREHYPLVIIKMVLKFSSTEDGIKNSAK